MFNIVPDYRFSPEMMAPKKRKPGISAFMRIRNGADFVEAAIRSHINFYDEIVVVYNQCTDATPEILERLTVDLGPKLRVFHYLPRVEPVGSAGHAKTPGDAPNSIVTYYNFALAMTRYQWAVKLDDDHLAIPSAVQSMTQAIRTGNASSSVLHCFSGPNLVANGSGGLFIPAADPISGSGDIGYFRVSEKTHFVHDKRFERFKHGSLERRFVGFLYWHLKFLKSGGGFNNYELDVNPSSRYVRKKDRMLTSKILTLPTARAALVPSATRRIKSWMDKKARLNIERDSVFSQTFFHESVEAALDDTASDWHIWLNPKN